MYGFIRRVKQTDNFFWLLAFLGIMRSLTQFQILSLTHVPMHVRLEIWHKFINLLHMNLLLKKIISGLPKFTWYFSFRYKHLWQIVFLIINKVSFLLPRSVSFYMRGNAYANYIYRKSNKKINRSKLK